MPSMLFQRIVAFPAWELIIAKNNRLINDLIQGYQRE
jgi:hypothetical protein